MVLGADLVQEVLSPPAACIPPPSAGDEPRCSRPAAGASPAPSPSAAAPAGAATAACGSLPVPPSAGPEFAASPAPAGRFPCGDRAARPAAAPCGCPTEI